MDNNLSTLLKEQYAAQKEYELSQLKSAYDKNVQALDEKAAAIPAQYETAKNEFAVQNAIAKKNFNEQAAATGLNTGTSGQAELARSNAYLSALSKLNRSEAETEQALERDRLSLQTDYQNAIAAQKAANEAELKSALYQEMVRSGNYGGGSGSGGSGGNGGGNAKTGYDTHGYTTAEIKAMQKAAGIAEDGIWGADTQAAYDAGYRPSVMRRQEELGGAYGTTAERDVAEMMGKGAAESAIFAYIDELTHAKYLTPSENTNLKLKYRSGKIGIN